MFPRLIQLEHAGSYPGGAVRQFERRALIGAAGWSWVRNSIKQKKVALVSWLLWQCGPMLAIALLRKFRQCLTKKTKVITLDKLQSATLVGTDSLRGT
jgi:hypothetical protein